MCSAPAQLIASATPGGLARSRSRSRATPPATCSVSGHAGAGHPAADDRGHPAGVRVVDPVVQAAALQRVVQVAGPVGGEHDDRRVGGSPSAQLGNGDGGLGQQLEQERLELVVAAVDLVDQQHGGPRAGVVERGQQRPLQQVLVAEQVGLARRLAARLGQPDGQQLARDSSTRTGPRPRSGPRSTAAGSAACPARVARALAASVLPTPGSPSSRIGCPIRAARNSAVPRGSSAR